jgi:hypothetical protein
VITYAQLTKDECTELKYETKRYKQNLAQKRYRDKHRDRRNLI